MKIENLRSEKNGNLARVAATVIWEDCDRPTQDIYFETTEAFASDLTCNPHTFLLACIMSALRHGEVRVYIDAEICPEFRTGVITAMSWIHQWYVPERQLVQIEAKTQSHPPILPTPERAGSFLSGGIDSLATLRANRLDFPLSHPRSIKDGLLISGLEIQQPEFFKQLVNSVSEVALDASVTLIPVYTNIRDFLGRDWAFWGTEIQGAVLAAVAHAFSRRLTTVTIPSSMDIWDLYPYGSHPLVDPNYSSSDLQIRHDSILLTRLDKTRLIADWNVALQNLKVCNQIRSIKPGELNCGQCEKCLRTRLELLALGVLDETQAFSPSEISEEQLWANVFMDDPHSVSYYRELIAPLEAKGRHDLVHVIKRLIPREKMKLRLEKVDRQFFKRKLLMKFYKRFSKYVNYF